MTKRNLQLPSQGMILRDLMFRITLDRNKFIDEQMRIVLAPKPKWLPTFLWHWVLRQLISLEHLPKTEGTIQ